MSEDTIPSPHTSDRHYWTAFWAQPMTDSLRIIHNLIDGKVGKPASQIDHVYRSSNGDLWQLIRETSPQRCSIRHTPNASSGGAMSEMSVEAFLAIKLSGPEHGTLRLLLEQEQQY